MKRQNIQVNDHYQTQSETTSHYFLHQNNRQED